MNVDKRTVKAAGFLYLVIILGSVFGGILTEMYLQSHLLEGAANTADTLATPEWSYRLGFVIYLLVYAADLATAVIFYELLKPVNHGLALLAAFFRFAEATILGINLLNQFNAFTLLQGGMSMGAYGLNEPQALAAFFLAAQRSGYLISQVFFGIHCFFLGYLLIKSKYFPKILGTFLVAASAGYLIESFSYFLLPDFESAQTVVSWISAAPAFLAEIALTYWLLFKGADVEQRFNLVNSQ